MLGTATKQKNMKFLIYFIIMYSLITWGYPWLKKRIRIYLNKRKENSKTKN